MAQPQQHTTTFASDLGRIAAVVQPILDATKAHDFPEDAQFAIRLALDEALSNAVRHGNCGDPTKHVQVTWSVDDTAATITIGDEGCGFIPDRVPDPTLDENIEKPCGRGVMLMQAYMTEVHFNKQGNSVTLVKRRDCTLPKRS